MFRPLTGCTALQHTTMGPTEVMLLQALAALKKKVQFLRPCPLQLAQAQLYSSW